MFKNAQEKRRSALQLYVSQELTMSEIARIEGRSRQVIEQHYKKHGIKPYKRPAKDPRQPKVLGMYVNNINKSEVHPQQVVDLYNAGNSLAQIAKMLNFKLSVNALHKRLKKAGVPLRSKGVVKKITDDQIIEAMAAGLSTQQIAKEYHMTYYGVWCRIQTLKKKGIL